MSQPDRDEMDAPTVRLLSCRIDEIMSAVMCSPLPPENRWSWMLHMTVGYFQTEHGIHHPCGEDFSSWREAAAEKGIELVVFKTTRDIEQRKLYAERMGPVVAKRMLDEMQRPEGS